MGEFKKTEIVKYRLDGKRILDRRSALFRTLGRILPDWLKKYPILDPRDRYQGRPLIGRDERIDQGVYIGEDSREALVVDFAKSPTLKGILEQAKAESLIRDSYDRTGFGRYDKSAILPAVFRLVQDCISERRSSEVNSFVNRNGWGNDVKVNLDVFYQQRLGVCRHMALGVGAIVEALIDEGILTGTVSVDRSTGSIGENYGGHAWVRYTSGTSGKVIILDPMLNYAGPLSGAMKERQQGKRVWEYARPEDY